MTHDTRLRQVGRHAALLGTVALAGAGCGKSGGSPAAPAPAAKVTQAYQVRDQRETALCSFSVEGAGVGAAITVEKKNLTDAGCTEAQHNLSYMVSRASTTGTWYASTTSGSLNDQASASPKVLYVPNTSAGMDPVCIQSSGFAGGRLPWGRNMTVYRLKAGESFPKAGVTVINGYDDIYDEGLQIVRSASSAITLTQTNDPNAALKGAFGTGVGGSGAHMYSGYFIAQVQGVNTMRGHLAAEAAEEIVGGNDVCRSGVYLLNPEFTSFSQKGIDAWNWILITKTN